MYYKMNIYKYVIDIYDDPIKLNIILLVILFYYIIDLNIF